MISFGIFSPMPKSLHMVMWSCPTVRFPSFRMMEGFGVHTFRLVNAEGKVNLSNFTGSLSWVFNRWFGTKP